MDTSKLSKKEASTQKNLLITTQEVFIISIWGLLQTCFNPKGPSSGNTDILHYLEDTLGDGRFIYRGSTK